MCFPTSETQISSDICFPLPGKRISLGEMCSPTWITHIPGSRTSETHIPSDSIAKTECSLNFIKPFVSPFGPFYRPK